MFKAYFSYQRDRFLLRNNKPYYSFIHLLMNTIYSLDILSILITKQNYHLIEMLLLLFLYVFNFTGLGYTF